MINLFDNNFSHAHCSIGDKHPKDIEYTRGKLNWEGITIFTDSCIFDGSVDRVQSSIKIAWLMEPPAISNHLYVNLPNVIQKFDYILTHNKTLLNNYPEKSFKVPTGGVWINEWVKYNDKNPSSYPVSIIYSDKQSTEGHKLRHTVSSKFKDIHQFGRGIKPIDSKEEALHNYYFSVVIENSRTDNYFTEKICDCFATSTIPIYWGPNNIGDFFNTEGIITFSDLNELDEILKDIRKNYISIYQNKQSAIIDNYNMVKQYEVMDDWIYNNILVDLITGVKNV